MTSVSNALLDAALGYADLGWPVLPLHTPKANGCSCGKSACDSVGKHPRIKQWPSNASADPVVIRNWWEQWPDANVGILTGKASGVLVVDVDNKGGKTGSTNLAALASGFGGLPPTLKARTGTGEHLFFAHPGIAIKNGVCKIAEGVDVRSDGGYVVAAPSLHANGTIYAWRDPKADPAELPIWLLDIVTGKTVATNRGVAPCEQSSTANNDMFPEGTRNNTLFKIGCSLRGHLAMSDEGIIEHLLSYNRLKCLPPLDEDEVLRIAASVCKYPRETKSKSLNKLERNPLYWFKFNVRDFCADQELQRMTDYQLGWWIKLLVSAWHNGGYLPADHDSLWRLAGAASKKRFQKHSGLVLSAYVEVEIAGKPRLMHQRLALDYADTLERWLKKFTNGGNEPKPADLTKKPELTTSIALAKAAVA